MLRPEARRAAARADLLHPQGEAQDTAQGRGDPQDLAAPLHDAAVHLHPRPRHGGRPGARPTAAKPPPEPEAEETQVSTLQLPNRGPRPGPRGPCGKAEGTPAGG